MRIQTILRVGSSGVLLLACAWLRPDFPVTLETDHYTFNSKASEEQIKEFTEYMELVFDTYTKLLKVDPPKDRKFPVKVYANYKEYLSEGKGPKGSAAYYSPVTKNLVGFYAEDKMLMYNIFAHEGMHQFVDIAFPNFVDIAQKVPWYTEGIADCIGNSRMKSGKLYMCYFDGAIATMRLKTLEASIKKGKTYSLQELLNLDKSAYYKDGANCYAHGWAFCHFILTYPKLEDSYRQVPEGRYKKFLAYFHEALSKKWTLQKALDYAFKYGQNDQAMPDMDKLNKEWKEYINKMIAEMNKRNKAKKKKEEDKKKDAVQKK